MRSAEADYAAIEAALHSHQVRTLHDLAVAVGLAPDEWRMSTTARVMAKDLAVANVVKKLCEEGLSRRHAVNTAAAQLNVDTETLQRRYGKLRRRHTPGQ